MHSRTRAAEGEELERLRWTSRLLAARVAELEGSFGEILRPLTPNSAIARAIESLTKHEGGLASAIAALSASGLGLAGWAPHAPPSALQADGAAAHAADLPRVSGGRTSPAMGSPIRGDTASPRRAAHYRPSIHQAASKPEQQQNARKALSTPPALPGLTGRGAAPLSKERVALGAVGYAHAFNTARSGLLRAAAAPSLHASLSSPALGTVLAPVRPFTSPAHQPPFRAPTMAPKEASPPVARGAGRVASRRGTPLGLESRNETWHAVGGVANAGVAHEVTEPTPYPLPMPMRSQPSAPPSLDGPGGSSNSFRAAPRA